MNEPPNPEVTVFAAALELPAGQRGAFLDQACTGDHALRGQVEALLRVHDEAGNFFDKLASVARPASAEGTRLGPSGTIRLPGIPTEKAGDRIGRYKLLQQIGEGGCGVVYMAEQEEPVRRRVALKVIKLGMDTKNVIARFEAERQALALMDHPNIAKVLDAGATETGRPYLRHGTGAGHQNHRLLRPEPTFHARTVGIVCPGLPGHSTRAPKRHHPSGYKAFQYSGHAQRRRPHAQGD